MNTLILNYPEKLPDMLNESKEKLEKEMKMALAVKLFEMKKISSGIAAELAGMDRVSFLFSLSTYSIAISNFETDELYSDVENA